LENLAQVIDANTNIRMYRELAEEYRSMDCATQVAKRHMVADHLRDVIDTIERKVWSIHPALI